jgi:hypothetical protein
MLDVNNVIAIKIGNLIQGSTEVHGVVVWGPI